MGAIWEAEIFSEGSVHNFLLATVPFLGYNKKSR